MKFPNFPSRCLYLLILASAWLGRAIAQPAATGTIEGRVRDAGTNTFIQNVRVSVAGGAFTAVTNAAGEYRLLNVPAGSVSLTAQLPNFAPQTKSVTVAGL